jgi:thymidylate kinase
MASALSSMTGESVAKSMTKIQTFIEELNRNGIRYCHWKSNHSLSESLAGQSDVDLLVHREDASLFRSLLTQHNFRPTVNKDGDSFPSVEHYFALDEESGVLVHVHAYFRVITGDSLAKNYRFPIEDMLLQNTRMEGSIPVLTKSAELVVFTVRMMLKHTSLVELILLARYWKQAKQEAVWLLEAGSIDETLRLVDYWLPSIDLALFSDCVAALRVPASLLRRISLGLRMRSQLRGYARHSAIRAGLTSLRKFTGMVIRRLTKSHKELSPGSGGAVIAFVGPEATGKSTLIAAMSEWLGEHFALEQIHVGKPKSTPLTWAPNLLVPALRSLFPSSRSTRLEAQYLYDEVPEKPKSSFPLIFGIRSVLLAYDRRALLLRAYSQAANGTIVLCDRYPSSQIGAPDGPQLSGLPSSTSKSSLRYRLASVEARLYRLIPPHDLVIYLSAPLEVALTRNATRGKKEPEDYVRRRHARSSKLEFEKTPVFRINTNQPFDKTILEVKKAIWKVL